jgi:8-hydroxy-5-deazaflavin:NADPH oxidoreductase
VVKNFVHTCGDSRLSVRDAINFGEAVLLAIPGTEMVRILEGVDFQNKIVMNSVNLADGRSAGMEVIRLAKNARVVRMFNTVPWEVIARPQFTESNATMFINGDVRSQGCGLRPLF